ncbi:MAG: hypothetical protein IT490_11815 [Candidatus Contendobacter sp.]|nr:hypothetical protein [Candidatus Contendobacter sp.]
MTRLPTWRIVLLRLGYLMIAAGLSTIVIPRLIAPPADWTASGAVVTCFLTAMMALCGLGVFRPIALLPVMLFELVWKFTYMLRVALPMWLDGRLAGDFLQTFWDCAPILLFVPIIPWTIVWRRMMPRRKLAASAGG